MLNWSNSTRQRKGAPQPSAHAGDPVSSGHGFSRAIQTRPQEPSPFVYPDVGRARLSNSRRLRRASANDSHSALPSKRRTGIMSTSIAKLDFPSTPARSITSNFLIDNICTVLRSPTSKSTSLGSSSHLHSSLVTGHGPQVTGSCSPLVTCHPPLSVIANDTHSREESSACKQSTSKILIANELQRAALTLSEVEGSFTATSAVGGDDA